MEIKQPFFSVIIPTTGGRLENLELVLTSLANQYFPRQLYEVIVVNDGGEREAIDVAKRFRESLDLLYVYTEKFKPLNFDDPIETLVDVMPEYWPVTVGKYASVPNIQPRNKGTLFANADFFIFADSDIILAPTALPLYFQDILHNPNRVILGIYHWLFPMYVTPGDILTRFDDIINEHIAKKLLTEIEPINPRTGKPEQTHNICRDMRMKDFNEFTPDQVFSYPAHLNTALAYYSGNICWPRTIFESIGGYTPYLHAGAHEDGYSGLCSYRAGHGVSYDNRIIGGHLYHPRNVEWVERLKWERGEIDWINQQFADFDEMKDVIAATEEEKKRLGIADWKDKGGLGW